MTMTWKADNHGALSRQKRGVGGGVDRVLILLNVPLTAAGEPVWYKQSKHGA